MKMTHFIFLFLLSWLSSACQTAVSPPTPIPPTAAPLPAPIASPTVARPFSTSITAVSTHDVTSQLPAYLTYSVTGGDVASIALVARGQDGALISHRPLVFNDEVVFWNGTASYVHDGLGDGAFVPTKRTDDGRFIAIGQYQRAGETHAVIAELYFGGENGCAEPCRYGRLLQAKQLPTTGNRIPTNLPVNAGDRFTFNWLHEFGDAPTLIINPSGLLFLEEREVENGRYQLGIIIENSAGETAETFTSVNVHHTAITSTAASHIDPYHAIAFRYPKDWTEPTSGTIVQTHNISNSITAAISFHNPLPSGDNALSLKQDALQQFGGVHLLFEEEIVLGERRGLRTVYGYKDVAGKLHTGVLLTAVNNNIGIIIDIDGLQINEVEMLTAAALLQESWQFLPTQIEATMDNG